MTTLLQGVNDLLGECDVLDSGGELASLTDSSRQTYIDAAVRAFNQAIDQLYSLVEKPKPSVLSESTITLVEDDRDYALDSSLVILRRDYHLIDETNNHIIFILGDDGYRQIVLGDIEQDDTGLPSTAAIRPTDGELFMDRIPTSNEVGKVYKYRFEKDLEMDAAADVFPFSDAVYRAIVEVAAELWKRDRNHQFDQGIFNASMARAARFLNRLSVSDSWMPSRGGSNPTDPLEE